MANIKSQIKRNKQNEKRHQRNKAVKSGLKTAVRKFREAAEAGDEGPGRRSSVATPPGSSTRPRPRASSTRTRPPTASRRSPRRPPRSELTRSPDHDPPGPPGGSSCSWELSRPAGASRRPVMVSTSRSSVYAASLAAPLMSASAWATARIARAIPPSDQPRDWSRMVRSFHGGTPDLAGQVGLAHPPRRGLVAGHAPGRAGERRGDQHRRRCRRRAPSAAPRAPPAGAPRRPRRPRRTTWPRPGRRSTCLTFSTVERLAGEVVGELVGRRRQRPQVLADGLHEERRRRPCRSVAPWRRTSLGHEAGELRGPQLRRLDLGDARPACAAW